MKKSKKKFISFLTIFILLFVSISYSYTGIVSFANENKNVIAYNLGSSKSSSISNKNNKKSTYKKYSTNKITLPSSGNFNSNSSKKNNTYTNKNNDTTVIKPDSGSFSTSPDNSSSSNGNSTTIKPDSGDFSTSPNNSSNKEGSSESSSQDNTYDSSGRGSYSGGTNWGKGLFGSYFNSYRSYGFVGGLSSWIVRLVTITIIIILIYIVIDYIRNRRD